MIRIVHGDDWHGLYIDGELEMEGHELILEDVLDKIGVDFIVKYVDLDWLYEKGRLPLYTDDIKYDEGN